jgi:hypothetical protein
LTPSSSRWSLRWPSASWKTSPRRLALPLTTQVGQAHAATGVPLDLGTNKQPSEPKHTNTHSGNLHGLLLVLHRSDRWPVSVRLVTPVRPVDRAGQTDGQSQSDRWTELVRPVATTAAQSVPESLSNFSRPWTKNTPKTQPTRKENPTPKLSKTTPNRPRTNQQHQDPKTHESGSSPEANPISGLHQSDRSRALVRQV